MGDFVTAQAYPSFFGSCLINKLLRVSNTSRLINYDAAATEPCVDLTILVNNMKMKLTYAKCVGSNDN